ncbi:MAG: GNAT family N-acetyltransferase [Actinomycetota bacterium]
MDDLAVRDLERNMWSFYSIMGCGSGGRLVDTPTRLVTEAPVPQPPYNAVLRFYDEGDRALREQAAELVSPMIDRGVTPVWVVHPTTDPRLRDVLTDLGLVCADELFGMCAELSEIESPTPRDDIEIIEFDESSEHIWLDLVSLRYGLSDDASPYLRDVYHAWLRQGTSGLSALVDGVACSKVAVHVADGAAGVYGVATTEAGRGKGLATHLCATVLADARAAGIERAVLHSTPIARDMYRRMGFRDVATFEMWAVPDSLHL